MGKKDKKIVYSKVNGFQVFYADATALLKIAETIPEQPGIGFQKTIISRTVILLFLFSLEALINRVASQFLVTEKQKKEFLYINKSKNHKRSFESKWLNFPTIYSTSNERFNENIYPWNSLKELIQIRNSYVHFKDERLVFYVSDNLPNEIKQGLNLQKISDLPLNEQNILFNQTPLKEKHLNYPTTKIPVDPYLIKVEDANVTKQVVDDVIKELNRLLDNKLKGTDNGGGSWLHSDNLTFISPPYSELNDLL